MADALCGAAAPIPPTGATACPVSEAMRLFCSSCGYSGNYAGTGPHTCVGCYRELLPFPSVAAPIPPTGATACPVSEAKRHFCSRCSHSGDYAGTGPHTCPGCDCELIPVPASSCFARPWRISKKARGSAEIVARLADHPPPPTARTLPTWPAKACADRVRYELHPVLAGLSLLTNSVRVLRAVDANAALFGSFADALKDACPAWADPFVHGGDASAEAVVSDLARYAADLCAEILVMDMNGGAA